MTRILDRVAAGRTFMRAELISDVFALAVARRMEDVGFLHRYQRYTRKLPLADVLDVWRSVAVVPRLSDRAEKMRVICDARLRGEEAHV